MGACQAKPGDTAPSPPYVSPQVLLTTLRSAGIEVGDDEALNIVAGLEVAEGAPKLAAIIRSIIERQVATELRVKAQAQGSGHVAPSEHPLPPPPPSPRSMHAKVQEQVDGLHTELASAQIALGQAAVTSGEWDTLIYASDEGPLREVQMDEVAGLLERGMIREDTQVLVKGLQNWQPMGHFVAVHGLEDELHWCETVAQPAAGDQLI